MQSCSFRPVSTQWSSNPSNIQSPVIEILVVTVSRVLVSAGLLPTICDQGEIARVDYRSPVFRRTWQDEVRWDGRRVLGPRTLYRRVYIKRFSEDDQGIICDMYAPYKFIVAYHLKRSETSKVRILLGSIWIFVEDMKVRVRTKGFLDYFLDCLLDVRRWHFQRQARSREPWVRVQVSTRWQCN